MQTAGHLEVVEGFRVEFELLVALSYAQPGSRSGVESDSVFEVFDGLLILPLSIEAVTKVVVGLECLAESQHLLVG